MIRYKIGNDLYIFITQSSGCIGGLIDFYKNL